MFRSLTVRLTLPIVFVGALMMMMGFAAARYVHREYRLRNEFISSQISGENALQELVFTVRDVRYLLRDFLLTGDVKQIENARQLRAAIKRLNDEAEKYVQTERGRELVEAIRAGEAEVFGELDQLSELTLPAMRHEVRRIVDEVLEPKLRVPSGEYLKLKHERVESGLLKAEEFSEQLVLSMTILALCGATAGVLWGLAVARGVGRSLVQLSVPIKSAAGQLSEAVGPLTVQTHWQFDELPAVVDRMAEQIGDVIEQMRASERRAERSEQLAAAGQLAAGMAHELRNPLTSMKLLVQAAQLKAPEGKGLGPKELTILAEEIERLERVVTTILDYARPPQMQPAELDLVDVVGRSVELIRDRFARRNVGLVAELPEGPLSILGDAGQLRQVWLNLLINALEASGPGQKVTVRVSGDAAADGEPASYVVEVLDEGVGLPTTLGGDIFEPFVTTKEAGLGLGLSISRRIIEEHGGQITAASRSGRGAAVRVELPAARRPAAVDESVAVAAADA